MALRAVLGLRGRAVAAGLGAVRGAAHRLVGGFAVLGSRQAGFAVGGPAPSAELRQRIRWFGRARRGRLPERSGHRHAVLARSNAGLARDRGARLLTGSLRRAPFAVGLRAVVVSAGVTDRREHDAALLHPRQRAAVAGAGGAGVSPDRSAGALVHPPRSAWSAALGPSLAGA